MNMTLVIILTITLIIAIIISIIYLKVKQTQYIDTHPDLLSALDEIKIEYDNEIQRVHETCSFIQNTEKRVNNFIKQHTVETGKGIKINMINKVVQFKDNEDVDLDDISIILIEHDKYSETKRGLQGEYKEDCEVYTVNIITNYNVHNIIKIPCGDDKDLAYKIRRDIEGCQEDNTEYDIPDNIKDDLSKIDSMIDYLFSLNIGDISGKEIDKKFEKEVCEILEKRCEKEIQKKYEEYKKMNTTKR